MISVYAVRDSDDDQDGVSFSGSIGSADGFSSSDDGSNVVAEQYQQQQPRQFSQANSNNKDISSHAWSPHLQSPAHKLVTPQLSPLPSPSPSSSSRLSTFFDLKAWAAIPSELMRKMSIHDSSHKQTHTLATSKTASTLSTKSTTTTAATTPTPTRITFPNLAAGAKRPRSSDSNAHSHATVSGTMSAAVAAGSGGALGAENKMQRGGGGVDLYLISDDDVVYEQDILRNPGSTRPWLAYAEFKVQHGTLLERCFVLERACTQLPRSYKLWKAYLELRVAHLRSKNPATHPAEFAKVNALFERALILLNKMPRIWDMYLSFLMLQPKVTYTRRAFDAALRALPITQHNRIWAKYKPFALSASGLTALKIWKRYMQVHPEEAEAYVDLLVETGEYSEAVREYIKILDNPRFRSREGKSNYQLWTEMVDVMVEHAREINLGDSSGIAADRIIRSGIERFSDQRGKLWTGLATYWITRGDFERARDIFEEGITTVMTVRDFTLIFDSYAEFEESIIATLMDQAAARSDNGVVNEDADFDLDIRMMRFEQLMDRRPFLVNDVLLRQNPNNVPEWEKRVALWGDNQKEAVQTYTDAIAAVNPKKAVGQFHQLWTNYAKLYEKGGDMNNSRIIMEKAVKVPFKSVAELAEMWCEWAEMELRNENFDRAVDIMAKATLAPKRSTVDYFDETLSPQQRVHKSWKLWSFYVDLVESVSSLDETRKVYERIFELRIATPQTVVNYANLLEENLYFEDSFKIYERGLELFSYPVAFELWNLYLTKAVDRKISIERLRDLFEQAVEDVPPKFAKTLYLMYGNLEEERGLSRHAMRIYERATRSVADEDRFEMFNFYITKSASNFGLTSTRPIYERAIGALSDKEAKDMCLKFAEMERRLGEIDRARAIYGHASQFCDPRTEPAFWAKWEGFEVQHGNEDTFKEMLRIKRSVQAQYNTDVSFIASQAIARSQQTGVNGAEEPETAADAMAHLDRQLRAPEGFVAASSGPQGGTIKDTQPAVAAENINPDALDVQLDDDDE